MGEPYMEFMFNMDVIEKVVQKIKEAKKYVRIAIFQIHNDTVYDAIEYALENGVSVEILTLPYDSINENVREKVKKRIERIKADGAIVYFSKWGIGDPQRTTTAVGRWYSLHGKILVTESVAISLSANLTEESELDAMLLYKEQEKINEFNKEFEFLLDLFGRDGIKKMVNQTEYPDKEKLFTAPKSISEPDVASHWIRDYPVEMCGNITDIENRLYISPIQCMARKLWEMIITEATEYVYISTESFTDTDIMPFLIANSIQGKKIKILTGSESQDFDVKIRELYPRLLANGIEMVKPKHPLHAKLLITDKRLAVSSVNLNKMNLGFAGTKALWRANTETILVESNKNTIAEAKADYEEIFNNSIPLVNYLSEKEENYAVSIFAVYGVKPDKNVKNLFSHVIVKSDIKLKRNLYQIGRYASIMVTKFNKRKPIVETSDFLCAMVLYYLSDRKHTAPELKEKISEIYSIIDTGSILDKLLQFKLITKEDEFFKLDLKTLLGEL